MAYLLDTCVLSELRKPGRNPGVATWVAGLQPAEAFLSVLTVVTRNEADFRRSGVNTLNPFS